MREESARTKGILGLKVVGDVVGSVKAPVDAREREATGDRGEEELVEAEADPPV